MTKFSKIFTFSMKYTELFGNSLYFQYSKARLQVIKFLFKELV